MSLTQTYRQFYETIHGLFDHRNIPAWSVLLGSLGIVLLTWSNLNQNQQTAANEQFELLANELSKTLASAPDPTTSESFSPAPDCLMLATRSRVRIGRHLSSA